MSCQHINEYDECVDCPDYPCPLVTERIVEEIAERVEAARDFHIDACERCELKRIVADFIKTYSEEEAWMTGDYEVQR